MSAFIHLSRQIVASSGDAEFTFPLGYLFSIECNHDACLDVLAPPPPSSDESRMTRLAERRSFLVTSIPRRSSRYNRQSVREQVVRAIRERP